MGNEYFLSIIVTFYNLEKYVYKCLDSIFLKQKTDYPIEVIAVDDGSSDSTWELLSAYHHHRASSELKIVKQENSGVAATWNSSISIAKGKYILFLDGDDFLIDGSLDDFLQYVDTINADIVVYAMRFFDSNCILIGNSIAPECKYGKNDFVLHSWLKSGVYTALRNKIVSREYLLKHNLLFIPGIIYEDVPWTAKLFAFDSLVAYSDIRVYGNVLRPGSITNRKLEKFNLTSLMIGYDDLCNFLEKENGLSNLYVDDIKSILSGTFFQMLSYYNKLKSELTPTERDEYLAYLEERKSIIKYSNKANRRYIYRFIAEVFGVKVLMKIKK